MMRTLYALSVALLICVVVFSCTEQITDPSASRPESGSMDNSEPAGNSDQSDDPVVSYLKSGPSDHATVIFGRENVGSPFQPPDFFGHDASSHAVDAIQPRTVVISAGGTVTFEVGPFHKIAIYEPGTGPDDIDITMLEDAGVPFDFPPIINDPENRITRGDLVLPGPRVPFEWTFEEPGRYFVICEVLPHFADNDMYAWVIVK